MNEFIIFPIIGFLIGWLTNILAIKLLFWPRHKIMGIQGIIPKRKEKLAEKISEASVHIFPSGLEKLTSLPLIGKKVENYIKKAIAEKINQLPDEKIEKIIWKVSKTEFRFIELLGGILGLLIGIIQAILLQII